MSGHQHSRPSKLSLDQALVRAMESRVKVVVLCADELDIEALTEYIQWPRSVREADTLED